MADGFTTDNDADGGLVAIRGLAEADRNCLVIYVGSLEAEPTALGGEATPSVLTGG